MAKIFRPDWDLSVNAARGEILLYGPIGGGFFFDGIEPKEFAEAVRELRGKEILVRINSPGGLYSAGVAMLNALRSHNRPVTTQVDAEASSAASLVAMGGKVIRIADNATMMIHEPWGGALGTASDLRAEADKLDLFRDNAAQTYAKRSGQQLEQILEWMAAETWFSATEALEAGLADEIGEPLKVAAYADRSRFPYQHAPDFLVAKPPSKSSRKACINKEFRAKLERMRAACESARAKKALH